MVEIEWEKQKDGKPHKDRKRNATSTCSGEWRQARVCPKGDLGQLQSYVDTDAIPPTTRALKGKHRDKKYLEIITAAFSFQRF